MQDKFALPLIFALGDPYAFSEPGNVMIKSYTVNAEEIPATDISVNNDSTIYLATNPGSITSQELIATLTPANANTQINWEIADDNIAQINGSGNTMTIEAINEGQTSLTVSSGNVSKTLSIIVSNSNVVCTGILIEPNGPDYYTLIAEDVISNPALNLSQEVQKVSMFSWSDLNQYDINAKVASRIPGTNNFQYENFPINDNAINNYFNHADNIKINVYGSLDPNYDGNMIGVNYYKWINQETAGQQTLGYIGYSENLGFVKPAGFNGSTAGTTGRGLHLEGLRVSLNVLGVEITTQAHIQNIGWLDPFEDGTYAGTMHRDLAIEGIKLTLEGSQANNYNLSYRVHQENNGWLDWVNSGQLAGSEGKNLPLEAIEIRLEQK